MRLMAICLLMVACGPVPVDSNGGSEGGTDAGPPPPPPGPEINFVCPDSAPQISNGTNSWPFGKLDPQDPDRSFHALMPDVEAGTKVGIVFSWHGIGDSLDNWVANTRVDNNVEGFPFIVISPHDAGMQPQADPPGLNWDMLYSEPGDDNIDAEMFETILACLLLDYEVDKTRIYSVGFSGGAIMTNLLTARYPDLFAATAPMSGAWFSDPNQADLIDPSGQGRQFLPNLGVEWNELGEGQQTVFMTHGGPTDEFGVMGIPVINFEDANLAAIGYLTSNGRNVIDCPHTNGHRNHPQLWVPDLVEFLKAHPWHEPSPWADGLPEPFAGAGCVFHAAQ